MSLTKRFAARHLEFIFPLITLHALSFSSLQLTGKLVNNNTFKELSLLLSRHFLSWEPSVLLVASSSLLKKNGRSLSAHKCRSFSLPSVCWTSFILVGVTQVPISSSPTFCAVQGDCNAEGRCRLVSGWFSSQSVFKVSMLMVARSSLSVSSATPSFTQPELIVAFNKGNGLTVCLSSPSRRSSYCEKPAAIFSSNPATQPCIFESIFKTLS